MQKITWPEVLAAGVIAGGAAGALVGGKKHRWLGAGIGALLGGGVLMGGAAYLGGGKK